MPFDPNIYSNQAAANFDIAGSVERGMRIGDLISRKKQRDKTLAQEEAIKSVFQKAQMKDKAGKVTGIDEGMALSQIAQIAPDKYLGYRQAFNQMNDANIDREYKLAQTQALKEKPKTDLQLARAKADIEIGKRDEKRRFELNKEREKRNRETMVPGYGRVRTAKEAQDIRQSMSDANDAVKLIDDIKTLGTDVSVWDRKKINRIQSKMKILAGKLRLPLTGPGAMTQDEYERLIDTMGDPSKVFGLESIEKAKLDDLKNTLSNSIKSKFEAARIDDENETMLAGDDKNIMQKINSMSPDQKAKRLQELLLKNRKLVGNKK